MTRAEVEAMTLADFIVALRGTGSGLWTVDELLEGAAIYMEVCGNGPEWDHAIRSAEGLGKVMHQPMALD